MTRSILSYPWWLYSFCYYVISYNVVVVHSLHPSMILHSRRFFLMQSSLIAAILPEYASSIESPPTESRFIKPYAPLEQLLPAVRVKQRIDRALLVLLANSSSQNRADELQSLLFPPPNALLLTSTTSTTTNNKNQLSPIYRNSYQRTREQVPLLAQPGAWLVQAGEIRAWKTLTANEQNLEQGDEFRAALNTYTNALIFDAESYRWTASPALKKQLIRQDQLPDVTAVIAADLDLRYLYRNQLLTALDDARAEWKYQTQQQQQQQQSSVDWTELVHLLKQAQMACQQWFDFIDERDVQEAIKVVDLEWEKK